jgi:hypothetical protein
MPALSRKRTSGPLFKIHPFLQDLTPCKAAWILARAGAGLRFCTRPNKFGNALGESLAGHIAGANERQLQHDEDARDDALANAFGVKPSNPNAPIYTQTSYLPEPNKQAQTITVPPLLPEEFNARRQNVLDNLRWEIAGQEAREDSLIGADFLPTAGPTRGAPRGPSFQQPGNTEWLVKNGQWDSALNLGADPTGLLGELPDFKVSLAQLGHAAARARIDDIREQLLKAGVKNVPGYNLDLAGKIDFNGTTENLTRVLEDHVRDQRLRETWGENYQNIRIGKSQFTVLQFEQKVLDVHLQATDRAYNKGVDGIADGSISVKPGDYARALGSYIDEKVRFELRGFAIAEGINDSALSNIWAINRRIKSNSVAGYGVPDGRIGLNLYHDTTLARKNGYTEQIQKWNTIRQGNFIIIRPSDLGGPYVLPRTSIQPYNPQPKLPGRKA